MKRLCWIFICISLLLGLIPPKAHAAQLEVAAKSAVLMDAATGTILFEQEADAALPPASVTKIMTMLLTMEAIDDGRIHWEDPVTASETAAAKGGSQVYLKVGESMTVNDMVKSIAVSSANDCACAMAEHIAGSEEAFVGKMNEKAQELGMKNTHFVNCTGLDDGPDAREHLTSARDIAIMSRELLTRHPDIKKFTTIWMDTIRNGAFGLSNTNKLVRFYKGATGLKTGFTSSAGYCLSATAEREGMELIAVVMGCETSPKRQAACKQMLDYGFANYALISPELPEKPRIPVTLGVKSSITAVPSGGRKLLIQKAQKGLIKQEVTLEESVSAPVSKGQRLGTLTIRAADQVLAEIPLVAPEPVHKLTLWQIFRTLLANGHL